MQLELSFCRPLNNKKKRTFAQIFQGKIHKVGKQGPIAAFLQNPLSLRKKRNDTANSSCCISEKRPKLIGQSSNKQNLLDKQNISQNIEQRMKNVSQFKLPSIKKDKIKFSSKKIQSRIKTQFNTVQVQEKYSQINSYKQTIQILKNRKTLMRAKIL